MPFCEECGTQVGAGDLYCSECGARQAEVPARADGPTPVPTATSEPFRERPPGRLPLATTAPAPARRGQRPPLEQSEDPERDLIARVESYAARLVETSIGAAAAHRRRFEDLQARLAAIDTDLGLWTARWTDGGWREGEFIPDVDAVLPRLTRAGSLVLRGSLSSLTASALLPLIGGRNLIIEYKGAARALALQAVQSLVLRLLATVAPGKLRLLLLDPVGLGQNVAGFMHLTDYMEDVVSGKAWSEGTDIEQQLADVTRHMEIVIQKYLRIGYATMEEYNNEAGEVAEPYRLVVAVDFPVNFTEQAVRRLVSVATNGPRCGVYVIVAVDRGQPLPYGFELGDLARGATRIVLDGERFLFDDPDFRDLDLILDEPARREDFERIVKAVGDMAKRNSRVEFDFARIALLPEERWRRSSAENLCALIGRESARKLQEFKLGEGMAHHGLVAGITGSGKSTLMHAIIMSLALAYSPDELQLYLVDFKQGVEFRDYATYRLPHARVVAIESEREFGLSVLQGLDAERERRGELFRQGGHQNIAGYRTATGAKLPRILLLVDEFQEFFVEGDAIASQAALILDRLVRLGRAFGIHVLLGSQTLAGAYSLARSTMDQMKLRIALQCSDADSRLILSEDNPAARLLSRPGEAIYNSAGGIPGKGNETRFQIAWLAEDRKREYLSAIQVLGEQGGTPVRAPIVFEGNRPARLEDHELLRDLLYAAGWPAPGKVVSAWLGEPVAIRPPTAARLRRQAGSNLVVVGRSEETAVGILAAALLSLATQHSPSAALFLVADLTSDDSPWTALMGRFSEALPHPVRAARQRGLSTIVAEAAEAVEKRLAEERRDLPSVYLFVIGLQRARELRQDDMAYYSPRSDEGGPPSPSERFATILKDGPEVGVHVLAWCDTYASLTRAVDRRNLNELGIRVALTMSAEDSTSFLGEPVAAKLVEHRALLHDEDRVGQFEKFRPYAPPSAKWLEWVRDRLKARA